MDGSTNAWPDGTWGAAGLGGEQRSRTSSWRSGRVRDPLQDGHHDRPVLGHHRRHRRFTDRGHRHDGLRYDRLSRRHILHVGSGDGQMLRVQLRATNAVHAWDRHPRYGGGLRRRGVSCDPAGEPQPHGRPHHRPDLYGWRARVGNQRLDYRRHHHQRVRHRRIHL